MPIADLQPVKVELTPQEFEHSIELRNMGDGTLVTHDIGLGGKNPEDFTLDPRGCANASLAHAQSCTMSVAFRSDIARSKHHGTSEAIVIVPDNATGSPHIATVMGTEGLAGHKKTWYKVLGGVAVAAAAAGGIYLATHDHPSETHTSGATNQPPPRNSTPPRDHKYPPQ